MPCAAAHEFFRADGVQTKVEIVAVGSSLVKDIFVIIQSETREIARASRSKSDMGFQPLCRSRALMHQRRRFCFSTPKALRRHQCACVHVTLMVRVPAAQTDTQRLGAGAVEQCAFFF